MATHEPPEVRRQQVAEALLATVAERGLAATALRDVAAAAGVSVGLVQRYFRTRAELLRFGMEEVYERATERMRAVRIRPPVRGIVAELVTTLFPVDAAREHEFRVWLAFIQESLHNPDMAHVHRDNTQRLIDGIAEALAGAQESGELAGSLDPAFEARCLMAFVDGLALHAVVTAGDFDREQLTTALEAYLDRLFSGPGVGS